jgi:hypothetical protein
MNNAFALGAAGAFAALIGAGSAQAQGFGISIGYGSPGFNDDMAFDTGWGWSAPFSWGGPRYVGSYYTPVVEPTTIVTTRRVAASVPAVEPTAIVTRRVVAAPVVVEPTTIITRRVVAASPVIVEPTTVVTRRVVTAPATVAEPRAIVTRRVVAAPAYDFYAEPRTIVSTRRVTATSPSLDVETTGSVGVAPEAYETGHSVRSRNFVQRAPAVRSAMRSRAMASQPASGESGMGMGRRAGY